MPPLLQSSPRCPKQELCLHPLGFRKPLTERGSPSCIVGSVHTSHLLSHAASPRGGFTRVALSTYCRVFHVVGVRQEKGGQEDSQEVLGTSPEEKQLFLPHKGQKGVLCSSEHMLQEGKTVSLKDDHGMKRSCPVSTQPTRNHPGQDKRG